MDDSELLGKLLAQLESDGTSGRDLEGILRGVCETLHQERSAYDWVGFYLAEGEKQELVLGPYVGARTEHTRIPFGKGICGQVALSKETLVVPDVAAEDNYLSCSTDVKSEIVIPIVVGDRFVAQIDIDSHSLGRFGTSDRSLLQKLALALAPHFA
jgi:L-methionine (R)-S-oxide reductase